MRYRCAFVIGIVSLVFLGARLASSAPFQISDITPAGWNSGGGYAVNAAGQAVGWGSNSAGGTRGFLYNGSTSADLGGVTGTYSVQLRALGINSGGQIAGWGMLPISGFVDSGGTLTQLPFLANGTTAQADAVDNAGEIAGYSNGPINNHATIWKNGVAYDLAAAGGPTWLAGDSTTITALSNNGLAVGNLFPTSSLSFYSKYSISGGVLTSTTTDLYAALGLGYPAALTALGVNDENQIVGNISNGAGSYGFLYTIGSAQVDLPLLGSGTQASAQGINDSGWVVGWSYTDSADTTKHAFLYHDGAMTDLNSLINPASGWTLTSAQAVSNTGYIVGTGTIGAQTHAFLLAPLAGDANLDGHVDVNDLTIVLSHFGNTGATWGQGDFNNDGKVDVNDLTILLTDFGMSNGCSGALASVPEPGTLVALVAGLVGLLVFAWPRQELKNMITVKG